MHKVVIFSVHLKRELREDAGRAVVGEQVGDARVPRRVELEPAVQGRHHVRGAVLRRIHIVLVQLGRLKRVFNLIRAYINILYSCQQVYHTQREEIICIYF